MISGLFLNSMDVFHVRLAAVSVAPPPPVSADFGTLGCVGNVMTETWNEWGIDPYDYYPEAIGGEALGLVDGGF